MIQLGFKEDLIWRVMMCVKAVTFSILINDKPMGLIKPSKGLKTGMGLRLGDPLQTD